MVFLIKLFLGNLLKYRYTSFVYIVSFYINFKNNCNNTYNYQFNINYLYSRFKLINISIFKYNLSYISVNYNHII